jgi:membrane protein implicated in regulation of membrane protease activity
MVRDFMLILLGIDVGTASPHLANMANAILGWAWGPVKVELGLAWKSFVVEAVVALIIIAILYKLDRRDKAKRDKTQKENRDNIQRIIDAIEARS